MLRATIKSLLARKLRLGLSGVAIILAVMFVSASMAVGNSLNKAFDDAFNAAYRTIQLQVTGQPLVAATSAGPAVPRNLGPDVAERVGRIPGVQNARGEVRVPGARVIGTDGKVPDTAGERFGMAWSDTDASLREGHPPQRDDEIVINAALAEKTGYHLGDRVGVLTVQPLRDFTVVGIAEYDGRAEYTVAEQTVSFTQAQAQRLLLGEAGAFSSVRVTLAPGANRPQVQKAIQTALGTDYQVRTGEEVGKDAAGAARQLLNVITYVLLGFAAVAVLAGTLLIVNAFSIVVTQRSGELAVLRAIGASRRQVRMSVLFEALVVGLVSWLVGLVLGVVLGRVCASALAGGDSGLTVTGTGVSVSLILVSFLVGVGVTVLAGLVPARRASRVSPVEAMREASSTDAPVKVRTIIGVVLLAVAVVLIAMGLAGDQVPVIGGGALLALVAVIMLVPFLTVPVVRFLGRPLLRSPAGRLGRINAVRHPRRTALTAMSLMVGVTLVTALSTVLSSMQSSIEGTINAQLDADISINSGFSGAGAVSPTISNQAMAAIRTRSDVEAAAGLAYEVGKVDGAQYSISSWDDIAMAARLTRMRFTSGAVGTEGLLMNAGTAKDLDAAVGDRLTVQLPRGEKRELAVTGVFADTTIADGVIVPWTIAKEGFRTDQPAQAFVKLRGGADLGQAKSQMAGLVKDSPEVSVRTRSELIEQAAGALGTIVGIVQVLLAVAMIIAILGVVNTLALSVLERFRELGMLRAIGMSRKQVRRTVTIESVLISVFGALLGLIVGAGLGIAIVRGLRSEAIDRLTLPWPLMAGYLVAAVAAGFLAALAPAARAAKTNVLAAIAHS